MSSSSKQLSKSFAPEINAILAAMGLPLEARDTPEKGKHVVAKTALDAGTELFEEIPVASWPMDTFLELRIPYCWWCLKVLSAVNDDKVSTIATLAEGSTRWCSAECRDASRLSYELLGGLNDSLHAFHRSERQRLHQDDEPNAASLPISVESVARCVSSVTNRIISIIKNQSLTVEDMATPSIMQQVFGRATMAINRFVEPPENSEFDEIDPKAWSTFLRQVLRQPMIRQLCGAMGNGDNENNNKSSTHVAEQMVDALLSDATLNTIIGQLSVNSQAVNTTLVLPVGPAVVCTGGALYTLQSNFNHSCDPNAVVSAGPSLNHEILVKLIRPVAAGEEITISYVPTEDGSTFVDRRNALKAYFFTCMCPRCVREEKAASTAAAAAQHGSEAVAAEEGASS